MKNWSAAEAADFAKDWEAGWNSHDLPRILRPFSDNIEFRSARAVALTGSPVIHGIVALERYWAAALRNQPNLRFKVTGSYAAPGMLLIRYLTHLNIDTIETLIFDDAGKVVLGSAARAPEQS